MQGGVNRIKYREVHLQTLTMAIFTGGYIMPRRPCSFCPCYDFEEDPATGVCVCGHHEVHHHPISSGPGSQNRDIIHTDAVNIGPWEKFKIVDAGGGFVAIQTSTGHYVVACDGGGRQADPIHTDAVNIGPWEKFKIVDAGGGFVAIQTSSGHYVVACDGGGKQ